MMESIPPDMVTAASHEVPDELPADVDEPPESSSQHINFWLPPKPQPHNAYAKTVPPAYMRRESLLTRQIHSETEHSDEEPIVSPVRGLSTVSTWSNPSTVSTAELTSDDGRSVPSPGISPALPPTHMSSILPVVEKSLDTEPKILGLESVVVKDPVEAGLGRKRCITFACGNKETAVTKPVSAPAEGAAASPPKRKCALKFVCPSKPSTTVKEPTTTVRLAGSPAPKHRRSSSSLNKVKVHRDSDTSTVLASPRSPRMVRKSPAPIERQASTKSVPVKSPPPAQLDNSDDSGTEATRFHEFATSEEEPDDWLQESTCHRTRLCVTDTLKKENVIRQLGQEVEDEVLAEEEEDEEELEEDEEDQDEDDVDDEEQDEDENNDDSDDGFKSDDEHGFAGSDSDDAEGSDNEWWTPGGASTAATSAEHLDQLTRISAQPQPLEYPSSLASMSSNVSPHRRPRVRRNHSKTAALDIERAATPDLPDSTDFVCGTLDEDRPQEQAYIDAMKERENAGKKIRPQDIDPSFPTSDPEMDEEDDEDIEDPEASSGEEIMHGSLDSIHGTARRAAVPSHKASIRQKSPAPTTIRHRSPAPSAIRLRSPAPTTIRHRSPAPRAKSPAPKARIRLASPAPIRAKSPAPKTRRHSPAPKALFGQSPRRMRSPAPSTTRMSSPPNTRRASPTNMLPAAATGLAGRPNTLTIAASLPKRPSGFMTYTLGHPSSDVEGEQTPTAHNTRRRGAIDIVKGLEKKKQRRREKLCQKLAAKAAARGEERKKIKPGRGAERMREVGLELQKYKGRAGHILSY